MRRTLRALTTWRLDGRSAIAVAVRAWKADIRRDLGGDLSRAQESILEGAAQAWVILSSLRGLLLRHAVERAEPEHVIAGVDADDPTSR